jgi:hypothetical protein
MQQQIEPGTRWRRTNRVGYSGISRHEFPALARFTSQAEALGFKMAVGKGPFGVGCRLKMSKGNRDYELVLNGTGQMLLGMVRNDGSRVRLHAGGTNLEAQSVTLSRVFTETVKGGV